MRWKNVVQRCGQWPVRESKSTNIEIFTCNLKSYWFRYARDRCFNFDSILMISYKFKVCSEVDPIVRGS